MVRKGKRDDWSGWARVYPYLEGLALGRQLMAARREAVAPLVRARNILVLGDGDGRFLAALMGSPFGGTVTSFDVSDAMVAKARTRLERAAPEALRRVRWEVMDVTRETEWPLTVPVDAIVAQFFFDNFDTATVHSVVRRATRWAIPGAGWQVAEFRRAESIGSAFGRLRQRLLLRILYTAFRWTAGIEATALPEWRTALVDCGWEIETRAGRRFSAVETSAWRLR